MTATEHLSPVPEDEGTNAGTDTATDSSAESGGDSYEQCTTEVMAAACTTMLTMLAALDRPPTSVKVSADSVDLELSWVTPPAPVTHYAPAPVAAAPAAAPAGHAPPAAGPPALAAVPPVPTEAPPEAEAVDHIHAPTVGVFYRKPDPSSPPFVQEGELVSSGHQVGIVEAMKLMIPVVTDRPGRIGVALKADASPVEYGEPLFTLLPHRLGLSAMFGSVLIANRGEIALRVVRTCRELGIRSIVVHSTEDRDSAAVRFADTAVQIGPAPARHSYLNMAAIVEAAVQFGADAIHPGYGFLSEDPDFGDACAENGIVFIGPPSEVSATLGDKTAARAAMSAAGLPLLPGTIEPLRTVSEASAAAAEVGFPLILKAAAGGGGRGMQIVYKPENVARAWATTRSTAQTLFGDNRVYLERYLTHARHVEIQVLCDTHGNALHIGERDCSVQRRHQKLIEESPAPGLDRALLDEMGAAAAAGALAVGYEGAGTFEFLVDDKGNYYFMEMNCRIQVEHPVTEMVSGLDLVAEQIRVAAGEPLRFTQDQIHLSGASVECRINAEDPERDFMPTAGLLDTFVPPGGPFVRTDTHCYPGMRVSPTYDSLLAKVIVWGEDRHTALERMQRALGELQVVGKGVHTTADYLRGIIDHPEFRDATHSTSLVERIASADAA